jgi:hypothetical protein
MHRVFQMALLTGLFVFAGSAFGQAEKPTLKVAMLIPIEPWDRKAGLEAWRKWLEENYRVEITWIEPKTPQPTKDTPEKERKEYYANPPEIPDLEKAADADVIFTALTHVAVNEKQSELLLKLLTTKPVVGGRRSHHGMNLKLPKGSAFALKNPGGFSGGYGDLIFGGGYAGHLGGTQQIKEGAADHPIVKGLPDLTKFSLTDRGYKHKIVANDEVTVLIEMKETKDPQTWCRVNKDTKQRTVYTVHDPRDIEAQESVRVMLARALFWAADKDEADYKK